MKDIYFEPNYGKLYEKAENGKAVCWQYEGEEGIVSHQFILREIPICVEDGPWYDIITPYGYGGPVVEKVNKNYDIEQLTTAFERQFLNYCQENKIVSEFVRFHPLIKNALDFMCIYKAQHIRQTLGTNLKEFENPVESEFSKSCRKTIRQALKKGITWKIVQAPSDLTTFREIYCSTMERNDANEYYYFDDEYFSDCLKFFKENILYVEAVYEGRTVAAGLYFLYDKTIHVHLSGTLSDYLHLSPAYILKYATTVWGKEKGYHTIHYGGGRSNDINDALYQFKKKFSQNTEFDFYIGKKIWNHEIYNKLCNIVNVENNQGFFPAYRV